MKELKGFTDQYSGNVASLITPLAASQYCTGKTEDTIRQRLATLIPADLFEQPVNDQSAAACCLSGLWLLHNFLNDSHDISQEIKSSSGGYWHGIMHRMEGDFWNSKYWFRQATRHPALEVIGVIVADWLSEESKTVGFTCSGIWDPSAFTDFYERNGVDESCSQLAFLEWQGLFDHCYREAIN